MQGINIMKYFFRANLQNINIEGNKELLLVTYDIYLYVYIHQTLEY